MGQSSSRHAAPSRVSFRRSIPTIGRDCTASYALFDDDVATEYDAPSRQRRTISHRAEDQSNSATPRHRRTSSRQTAPATSRKGHRASQSPKISSRQSRSQITPDRIYYHEGLRSADRRNGYAPSSANPGPRSQNSLTASHCRRSRPEKECVVCTDSRSLPRFPSEPPTARCAHDADVCRRCLRTWISTSFSSKAWDEINCPTCAERLMIEDVRHSAPSEVYRQYKWFHTKAELETLPGWHWCISEGCKSGQQIAQRTSKFKCVRCKKVNCAEHNVPWHKGETCKQYEQRSAPLHTSQTDWN
jgi:DNA-directed RNA polymerase subunit RPC12/RpoP